MYFQTSSKLHRDYFKLFSGWSWGIEHQRVLGIRAHRGHFVTIIMTWDFRGASIQNFVDWSAKYIEGINIRGIQSKLDSTFVIFVNFLSHDSGPKQFQKILVKITESATCISLSMSQCIHVNCEIFCRSYLKLWQWLFLCFVWWIILGKLPPCCRTPQWCAHGISASPGNQTFYF